MYASFARWRAAGEDGISLLARALKKSAWRGPQETGAQRMQPRSCPVEAQSVKNTGTQAKHKGYDAGKKVSVIKWHIGVDTRRVAACLCGEHGTSDGLLGSGAGALEWCKLKLQRVKTCCVTVAIGGNPSPECGVGRPGQCADGKTQ